MSELETRARTDFNKLCLSEDKWPAFWAGYKAALNRFRGVK